jgi:hypothetical protein
MVMFTLKGAVLLYRILLITIVWSLFENFGDIFLGEMRVHNDIGGQPLQIQDNVAPRLGNDDPR